MVLRVVVDPYGYGFTKVPHVHIGDACIWRWPAGYALRNRDVGAVDNRRLPSCVRAEFFASGYKVAILYLANEIDQIARLAASEAMPQPLARIEPERRATVRMKRTLSAVFLPRLFQRDIGTDYGKYIHALQKSLNVYF
jgi:hypothetical protein